MTRKPVEDDHDRGDTQTLSHYHSLRMLLSITLLVVKTYIVQTPVSLILLRASGVKDNVIETVERKCL